MRHTLPLSVCVLVAASAAHGAIITTTGSALQISAPSSAMPFAQMGPNAFVWNERLPMSPFPVNVDMTVNPSNSTGPTPGAIVGAFDTHFIHFQDLGTFNAIGSVTFNGPIVGVAYSDLNLDTSDAVAGAPLTVYPTGFAGRGMNSMGTIWINGPVLKFEFHIHPGMVDMEQVRVYTVPAPASAAVAGLGMLAGARRRRHLSAGPVEGRA